MVISFASSCLTVNGSLSESLSLTLAERKQLTETWLKAAKGRLEVIVHVGSNCLKDSQALVGNVRK